MNMYTNLVLGGARRLKKFSHKFEFNRLERYEKVDFIGVFIHERCICLLIAIKTKKGPVSVTSFRVFNINRCQVYFVKNGIKFLDLS